VFKQCCIAVQISTSAVIGFYMHACKIQIGLWLGSKGCVAAFVVQTNAKNAMCLEKVE